MVLTAVLNLPHGAATPRAAATGDTQRRHDLCGPGRRAQMATPQLEPGTPAPGPAGALGGHAGEGPRLSHGCRPSGAWRGGQGPPVGGRPSRQGCLRRWAPWGAGSGWRGPVKLWLRPAGRGREVATRGATRTGASLLAFLPGLGSQWTADSCLAPRPLPPQPAQRLQRVLQGTERGNRAGKQP